MKKTIIALAIVLLFAPWTRADWFDILQRPGDCDKTLPLDQQVLKWDDARKLWVPSDEAGGTPGGSDTQVQFNDGGAFGGDAGLTYAKATDILSVVGGVKTAKVYPSADSTTAFQINRANGTDNVFNVDTTNLRVGIGTTAPSGVIDVNEYVSQVPQMASNTAPSPYVISASAEINWQNAAWQAFCVPPTNSNGWICQNSTGWIKVDVGAANVFVVKRYTMTANGDTYAPKTWTFEGSNTGAFAGEQTVLDTQTNVADWTTAEERIYLVTNSVIFRYYRWNITANQGGSWILIRNLQIFLRESFYMSGGFVNIPRLKSASNLVNIDVNRLDGTYPIFKVDSSFKASGSSNSYGKITLPGGAFMQAFWTGAGDGPSDSGMWIDMPTRGGSGIGSGGAGNNAWIAYCPASGNWFTNSAAGDIAYRAMGTRMLFGNQAGAARIAIQNDKLGLHGNVAPTAGLHLGAGTATAGMAPLKLTTGVSLTTAELGAIEFTDPDYFASLTDTTVKRKAFVLDDGTRLTSGRVPFATTNGRLTDDADLTFVTDTLTATKIVANTSLAIREGGATPTKYTFFQGGDQTIDLTYTLPTAYPAVTGYVLSATDAGAMSWVAASGEDTGSIKMFGSMTPPSGWLNCDGSVVSRTTYAALFAVIGIQFGAGNGTTTFQLPWMSNRFPMGAEAGYVGNADDTDTHQHDAVSAGTPTGSISPHFPVPGFDWTAAAGGITDGAYADHTFTGDAMGTHQHAAASHIPPYQKVNFIIKT